MNEPAIEHNVGRYQIGGGDVASAWLSLFTGPVVWAGQMQLSYSLVPWACRTGHILVLHLVSPLGLILIAGGSFLGWRVYERTRSRWQDDKGGVKPALSFMSTLALTLNALFFVAILAQWIPKFFFDPCHR
jgi:hypothetical protein